MNFANNWSYSFFDSLELLNHAYVVLKKAYCCMQALISLAFQQRLTEHLHDCYLSNRVYYVASTLRGLSNADQVRFANW